MRDEMLLDQWIILSLTGSYLLFWGLQMFMLRCMKSEEILKSVMQLLKVTGCLHFWVMYMAYKILSTGNAAFAAFGWKEFGTVGLLSFFLLGLLMSAHVLCVIGPYETSIRFRLLRELNAGPRGGMALPEILKKYNAEVIVQNRLKRFLASQEIACVDGIYKIQKDKNIFSLIDRVTQILNKLISL